MLPTRVRVVGMGLGRYLEAGILGDRTRAECGCDGSLTVGRCSSFLAKSAYFLGLSS